MQKIDVSCGCGAPLRARGKATAKECRACYQARRSANRKTDHEYRQAQYARDKAKAGKSCIDCGVGVSSEAKRCRACQNRRPEINVIRAQHVRETRHAKNEPKRREAYHRRARVADRPPQPCARCGDINAQVHHVDRDFKNNDPSNLEWLCKQCHLRYHASQGHLGPVQRNPKQHYICSYCGALVFRYTWEVPNGIAFCNRDHYTQWRRVEVRPRRRAS